MPSRRARPRFRSVAVGQSHGDGRSRRNAAPPRWRAPACGACWSSQSASQRDRTTGGESRSGGFGAHLDAGTRRSTRMHKRASALALGRFRKRAAARPAPDPDERNVAKAGVRVRAGRWSKQASDPNHARSWSPALTTRSTNAQGHARRMMPAKPNGCRSFGGTSSGGLGDDAEGVAWVWTRRCSWVRWKSQ